ncbi:MAG: PhoU domain-containing protein [Candidatus Zixiibacteriota bacterium]
MFKKFKELFSSESLLDAAYNTTLKMLDFDHKMFLASRETLRQKDTAELPFDIHQTDRKINRFERQVRRDVLTHLTVAGIQNLVPGLILVSIVIDVERIGDYTKNIADLASKHPARLKGGPYEELLHRIEAVLEDQFPKVIQVLSKQDKALGRGIMQAENIVGKASEKIVSDILVGAKKNRSLSTSDCVALALYARYLKRINAHLTNVASAIVNPFPRISFREKKKRS